MHRSLAILLLILLSLQFSWAAAVPYAKHEIVSGLAHETQQLHDHQTPSFDAVDEADGHVDDGVATCSCVGDRDCDYCHVPAASPAVPRAIHLPLLMNSSLAASLAGPLQSRGPDRHERPKWRIA